jgi:hypothetical protein
MDKMLKKTLFYMLFMFVPLYAGAQKVTFTAEGPGEVLADEPFRIVFTLSNAQGEQPELANPLKNFEILSGPFKSEHRKSQIGARGDEITVTKEYYYTYTVRAKKTGKLTFPSAKIKAEGKVYHSNSLTIRVNNEDASKGKFAIKPEDAFIKAIVQDIDINGVKAYQITYRLYSIYNIYGIGKANYPGFEDFNIVQERTLANAVFRGAYENRYYNIVDLKQFILQPVRAGERTIPAGNAEIIFRIETGNTIDSFFGPEPETIDVRKVLDTESFTINAGLVGNWKSL